MDYALGWNFGPYRVGATGGYLKQLSNDTVGGLTAAGPDGVVSGNKGELLTVGPSVNYTFQDRSELGVSWQKSVYVRNQTDGAKALLTYSTRY